MRPPSPNFVHTRTREIGNSRSQNRLTPGDERKATFQSSHPNERISAKTFISHVNGAYLDLLNEETE